MRPGPAIVNINLISSDLEEERKRKKKEKQEAKQKKMIEWNLNFTEKGKFDKGFDEFSDGNCTICLEAMVQGVEIWRVI